MKTKPIGTKRARKPAEPVPQQVVAAGKIDDLFAAMGRGGGLGQMIQSVVRCTLCGAGYGACDCWTQCSCGWTAEKGKPCNNPNTSRCSTKVAHGKPK